MKLEPWTSEAITDLEGTLWSGKGGLRLIVRIQNHSCDRVSAWFLGDVFWSRPGGPVRKTPQYGSYFCEWLRTAEPANGAAVCFAEKYGDAL